MLKYELGANPKTGKHRMVRRLVGADPTVRDPLVLQVLAMGSKLGSEFGRLFGPWFFRVLMATTAVSFLATYALGRLITPWWAQEASTDHGYLLVVVAATALATLGVEFLYQRLRK